MKRKLLVIIQDISKAQEHEWFVEYINRELFDIHFLMINGRESYMEKFLVQKNVAVHHADYSGKKELLKLVRYIYHLVKREKFEIIHTHLFEASLTGLLAGFIARVPVRLYTRHFSDYHHVWFPGTVKYDRFMNWLATGVIATSQNVKNVLINMEGVPKEKVHLVHHGIDMTDYSPGVISRERVEQVLQKYNLHLHAPVIGAISRFTELKGLQYLIPAFEKVLVKYPGAVLVLANASGDYSFEIGQLLQKLDARNYRLIPFENDIAALYKTFDCFVHIPINVTAEAFGQTYLEALASCIPSVFTLSGVAPEFIVDRKNAIVVPYCNAGAVENAILYILENKEALKEIIEQGYETVRKTFDIHIKIKKLEQLYSTF